ncbi:MAG TPA: glycoside hydrolase family 2 TIM barrel-domain containing protein [Gemmatimonadaceae bacterium]|nr:glycoside hydrolase family 2 TIM barrel-domain containing protein [Gemmatimonadaceae bacterium]
MTSSRIADPGPRPQMERAGLVLLDGNWQFALDPDAAWRLPEQVKWKRRIIVPFAPETPASGIANTSFYLACWYRRTIRLAQPANGSRVLLTFGAVDSEARVWVNGQLVAEHVGGYTPFTADITDALIPDRAQEIVVRAYDDPHDLAKPRGKQDWRLNSHSIWYPRTTGIWQSVWYEVVPSTYIRQLRWTSNLERWEIGLEAWLGGDREREGMRLHVKLLSGATLLADDTYAVIAGEVHRRIALSDPGIDDVRNELLWSPERPTIIRAEIELWAGRGELLDVVRSYTALRTVGLMGDRIALNGRPYQLRLVLDQGYWPDTGMTPPSSAALRRDIELTKALGFNGVRKHQKVEDPRYLYWADHLGLVVWEEMPSAYRFTMESVKQVTKQWMEVIERDYSHPCIVVWVPFNESWGIPDLPAREEQRHYVRAIYHLTKTIDNTRLVVGNDGWEHVATDIVAIHDYESDPKKVRERYDMERVRTQLVKTEYSSGRNLVLPGFDVEGKPIMLSEFGGIAYAPKSSGVWGYSWAKTEAELATRYRALIDTVKELPLLAGFCYTQLTDTYQEANGLLFADRRVKGSIKKLSI